MTSALNKNTLRCGTCIHFADGPAHTQYPKLCQEMGIRDYRPAPDCYSPAPLKIVRANVDVSAVGKLVRHLEPDQMIVLGQLLTQAAELAEYNLKFGQPVYINLGSGEYLTNYFKAFVVGSQTLDDDEDTVHIYVSSDLTFEGEDTPDFRSLLRLTPDSLVTTPDFRVIKERLVTAGKLEAPAKIGHRIPLAQWIRMEEKPELPPSEVDAYEPPTIDTAPAAWLDPFSEEDFTHFQVVKKVKKKKGKDAMLDPSAEAKRRERAKKRLQMDESIDEEGNVVKTISHRQIDPDVTDAELVEIELGMDDLDLPADLMRTGGLENSPVLNLVYTLPRPLRH